MVVIWGVQGTQGQQGVVYPDYLDWRAQNRTFDDMGVFRGQSVNLTGARYAGSRLFGMFVSASFMRLIGATAEQGRIFTDAETEIATKAPVAIVTHEAWETRFGGDPAHPRQDARAQRTAAHGRRRYSRRTFKRHSARPTSTSRFRYYPNAQRTASAGIAACGALGTLKPGVTFANAAA